MENSKITKKQKGQETELICQANKEKYEGISEKKELYFTLPISTYYKVPKDRKLDLLPTKEIIISKDLIDFPAMASHANVLSFLYVTHDAFYVFSKVRNQNVSV